MGVAAELWREDREFGERLSTWEDIVVIGIIEDRRIWSNRGGFPADRAAGSAP
jgi:hypothetical protein